MKYMILTESDPSKRTRRIMSFEGELGMEKFLSFLTQEICNEGQIPGRIIATGGEEILSDYDKLVLARNELKIVPVSNFMMGKCTYENFKSNPRFVSVATVPTRYVDPFDRH